MRHLRFSLIVLMLAAGAVLSGPLAAEPAQLRFEIRLDGRRAEAEASIAVHQKRSVVREIRLGNDGRLGNFRADGELIDDGDDVLWRPPATGGTLSYRVVIDRQRQGRNSSGYDAIATDRWALFRGERAFPVRSWRLLKGADIGAELAVRTPRDWTTVTPYRPDGAGRLAIKNPGNRMARPTGWILTGDIATRTDVIDGVEVSVSAPRGIRMQRIGTLAVLRWTLPTLLPRLRDHAPDSINIVSAGSPMWLGALAAPNSVFVHADRPLISGNGTSTIVHEVVHILLRDLHTDRNHDWIDEGLAEYLSLWAMRDSGTISASRYDEAIAHFRSWGSSAKSMKTTNAGGAVTARAVAVFHDLDTELQAARAGSLFDLLDDLYGAAGPVDLGTVRNAAQKRLGAQAKSLSAQRVPGFD